MPAILTISPTISPCPAFAIQSAVALTNVCSSACDIQSARALVNVCAFEFDIHPVVAHTKVCAVVLLDIPTFLRRQAN